MDEGKRRDLGLLVLRVGIGVMFVTHGLPKNVGGRWAKLGEAMGNLGIEFAPTFWGFAAAISEFGGGLLLAAGVLFRPACALMLCTMIVASINHFAVGDGLGRASHAIEAGILFLSLLLIGPGRHRLRRPG
jgi:putative oxidoreductase